MGRGVKNRNTIGVELGGGFENQFGADAVVIPN